jgi:Fe-S-cluster-containing hydrogenase component 2
MSRIFKQKRTFVHPTVVRPEKNPIELVFSPGAPTKIVFDDGDEGIASCLHCTDAPCLNFSENELANETFPDFPQDLDTNVCATNALSWNEELGVPEIDETRCILCGVCVARCPIGALYLDYSGVRLNFTRESYLTELPVMEPDAVTTAFQDSVKRLKNIPRKGKMLDESDEVISRSYERLMSLDVDAQFPNLLTRNLLIACGIHCSIRRRGDVNLRMDGLVNRGTDRKGVIEVEFDWNALLDSPRSVLDDIAVLMSRYEVGSPESIVPIVICLSFPNSRSEYWRVVKDIFVVLGLRINSLTIGSLMLFVWNWKELDLLAGEFYADSDSLSIRDAIERRLGRQVGLSQGTYSILEAGK